MLEETDNNMRLPTRDIHSHLLPGVDDGFRSAEDSLRALREMSDAGCREFVFTPHINPDVYPGVNEETHKAAYDGFVRSIPSGLDITTSLAAEYMVVAGFEDRVSGSADTLLRMPDGSVLVEMSYMFRSRNLESALFELNIAGFRPILAHPERYTYMSDDLSEFDRIVDMGCSLQLNLMSVTGAYGPASVKIMKHLLRHDMYSYIASDLHSLNQLKRIMQFRPGFFMRRDLRLFMKKNPDYFNF
mgnify:CR=1 FL=1